MTRIAILPALLCFLDLVSAVRFNVHGRSSVRGFNQQDEAFMKKRAMSTGSDTLANAADLSYYSDALLGGTNYSLLIDTGSSDLWVGGNAPPPNSQSTGKTASVIYAVGSASGPVLTTQLDFLGYTVQNQAFIFANGQQSGQGLIGLGPDSGSQVQNALSGTAGSSVVNQIFLQNTTTPNYITILLGRSDDPTDPFPGEITIGEIVQGYNNVTSQPMLPVTRVAVNNQGNQHVQLTLDQNGIIGPDGQPIQVTSVVNGGQNLTAVMDSGFSLPQLPRQVSDAIYSRVPGSIFQNISGIGGVWTVPCTAEINITFIIGGVNYAINPLDTSLALNQNGQTICVGSFQPKTLQSNTFDMILGMSFLRNAYMLVNYGNFVQGKPGQTAPPFVQLLSTNTPAEGHKDFVTARLNGVDTTGSQSLLPNVRASGPPDSTAPGSSSNNSGFTNYVSDHKWLFIGLSAGIGVLLLALCLWCCCRRNGRKRWMKGVPVAGGSRVYRPLEEPAPLGEDHYEYKGQY